MDSMQLKSLVLICVLLVKLLLCICCVSVNDGVSIQAWSWIEETQTGNKEVSVVIERSWVCLIVDHAITQSVTWTTTLMCHRHQEILFRAIHLLFSRLIETGEPLDRSEPSNSRECIHHSQCYSGRDTFPWRVLFIIRSLIFSSTLVSSTKDIDRETTQITVKYDADMLRKSREEISQERNARWDRTRNFCSLELHKRL